MAKKEVVQLRCSQQEKELWAQAADRENMELSPWIRLILNQAAQQRPTQ